MRKCKQANPGVISLYDQCENLIPIQLRTCTNPDQSEIPECEVLTQGCSDMVKSIKYVFGYKNPEGIVEAFMDVEFVSLDPAGILTPIPQTFEVVYAPYNNKVRKEESCS